LDSDHTGGPFRLAIEVTLGPADGLIKAQGGGEIDGQGRRLGVSVARRLSMYAAGPGQEMGHLSQIPIARGTGRNDHRSADLCETGETLVLAQVVVGRPGCGHHWGSGSRRIFEPAKDGGRRCLSSF
jgi:hypothetical protein